jgi:hypothetical protein
LQEQPILGIARFLFYCGLEVRVRVGAAEGQTETREFPFAGVQYNHDLDGRHVRLGLWRLQHRKQQRCGSCNVSSDDSEKIGVDVKAEPRLAARAHLLHKGARVLHERQRLQHSRLHLIQAVPHACTLGVNDAITLVPQLLRAPLNVPSGLISVSKEQQASMEQQLHEFTTLVARVTRQPDVNLSHSNPVLKSHLKD